MILVVVCKYYRLACFMPINGRKAWRECVVAQVYEILEYHVGSQKDLNFAKGWELCHLPIPPLLKRQEHVW